MAGLLAFHAHPDDEAISMGGALARYVAGGESVVVVTATRGEAGEVHNYDDADAVFARLAEVRAEEIAAALGHLGVTEHHFLGYRDSGMMGTEANAHPDAFWGAEFDEAAGRLVRLIRRYQPDVVTCYDPFGGYGHPDHMQVHRVGMAAFFGAPDVGRFPLVDDEEPWMPSKLYWSTFPRSAIRRFQEYRLQTGEITAEEAAAEPGAGALDHDITLWLDVAEWADAKEAAILAHTTQIPADSWFRRLEGAGRMAFLGREPFTRVFSRVPVVEPEDDLFSGLR